MSKPQRWTLTSEEYAQHAWGGSAAQCAADGSRCLSTDQQDWSRGAAIHVYPDLAGNVTGWDLSGTPVRGWRAMPLTGRESVTVELGEHDQLTLVDTDSPNGLDFVVARLTRRLSRREAKPLLDYLRARDKPRAAGAKPRIMKPRTLTQLRNDPRVHDVWQEDDDFGLTMDPPVSGPSWWLSLAPGWVDFDGVSTLHEMTVRELIESLHRNARLGVQS